MREQQDIGAHLIAVGRVLGHLDSLEAWLDSLKIDVAEVTQDPAVLPIGNTQGGDIHGK